MWNWYKEGRIPGAFKIGRSIMVPDEMLNPGHNVVKIGVPSETVQVVLGKSKRKVWVDMMRVLEVTLLTCYGEERGKELVRMAKSMLPMEWEDIEEEIVV